MQNRGDSFKFFYCKYCHQDTFGRAKTWVKELQRQASPNIVIALAGNKADLSAKRAIEFEVNKTTQAESV